MTLNQLIYLLAVDTYRNFGVAAESCFVTQRNLSEQIGKLEQELGEKLIDRTKNPVTPTPIGALVIEQAKQVVNEAGKINEIIREKQDIMSGEIKVGIVPTIAPYLLPILVPYLNEHYPQIALYAKEMMMAEIIDKLKRDQIDVGIGLTPLGDVELQERPLFTERIMAYVSPSHPFKDLSKINPDQIMLDELWLMSDEYSFSRQIALIFERRSNAEVLQEFHYESQSFSELIALVDKHYGITMLPELSTLQLTAKQKKRLKPIKGSKPLRQIGLLIRRDSLKLRKTNVLYECVRSVVPEAMVRERVGTLLPVKI